MNAEEIDPRERQELNKYSDLVDLARHSKQAFSRTLTTSVHHLDRGILVVATLTDTWHDMRMAILVDPVARVIADIRTVMLRYPFHTCPEAPEVYRRLVGLALFEAGTFQRIHKLIPRREGCSHLYALLEACLRALFIGGGRTGSRDSVYEVKWDRLPSEQRRILNMRNPALKGTCHSFSQPPTEEIPAEVLQALGISPEEP